MTKEEAVTCLWDYHHVQHTLIPADLLFVLGSNDSRVAEWAAELYHRGFAQKILFSGGAGRFTHGLQNTEAERFALVAQEKGVPAEDILLENKSTNTGENVRFSRMILEQNSFTPTQILALQKPYMERRTLATLEAQWPEISFQVSSPPCSFAEYLTEELPEELVISAMVGDYQRIREYPKQGFSTEQPFNPEAEEAFQTLVALGYTSQLLS